MALPFLNMPLGLPKHESLQGKPMRRVQDDSDVLRNL